ncbi:hypothetical protein [Microbulbifer aggregans]|uniref:hypothetical protein n=1 Tax=Microbulbifer aggregans TaxID=1769779 RepID=UPI001CFF400D|nr:hypothetical protein [Microbulbifer aggregans]
MLRVIGVLLFALLLLWLAGYIYYKNKGENETSHTSSQPPWHIAASEITNPAS